MVLTVRFVDMTTFMTSNEVFTFVMIKKMLRRIFGPRSDEVTGEWRRLHNEELNGLYC